MKGPAATPWEIWIDTGGTFTDCVARDPAGRLHRAKVLSTGALRGRVLERLEGSQIGVEQKWGVADDFIRGFRFGLLGVDHEAVVVARFDSAASVIELKRPLPDAGRLSRGAAFEVRSDDEAPVIAARMVTRTAAGGALPPLTMRLATTRGTNALLQRAGAATALFVTRGFGDLLAIGDQQRPDLFALCVLKPAPLYEAVEEVDERVAADGSVVVPLDLEDLARRAQVLCGRGIRAAAVALVNSYRNPTHERRVAEMLTSAGFDHVTCSSELAPLIKILPRAQTAVVDAYLSRDVREYLDRVGQALSGSEGPLHVMTSAGGLVSAHAARAADTLLSGPAAGVVGAAAAGRRCGFSRIIGFDMGGTSTDVARFDGDFEYRFEHRVGDARVVAPALSIETVAAGGGSICAFTDGRLTVGPASAQAHPGPACYGAGGPLTLTDVNVLLGRLDPARFEIPIWAERAADAFEALRRTVSGAVGGADGETLLEGFLDIANERMAGAIAEVSLRAGYDPREYALVAFGGAGGQHACAVAGPLMIETVIMPANASLLSAEGLGDAVIQRFAHRQVLTGLEELGPGLPRLIEELGRQAVAEVAAEGVSAGEIVVRRRIINLRLFGQETSVALETSGDSVGMIKKAFAKRYRDLYGHAPGDRPIEVESVRVVASTRPPSLSETPPAGLDSRPEPAGSVRAWFQGRWRAVPVFERAQLSAGAAINGPALVFEAKTACVVEVGWTGRIDGAGALVLRRQRWGPQGGVRPQPEVVRRELFANRLTTIARQMGRMLQRTALSTNVKERLDFSCAVLDPQGHLVVNAPHIPVHLGAMGLCVRALRKALAIGPSDVVVTNHPAYGGSHLPDVTVVTAVHANGRLLGYVANRAHHAEIGGSRPGSMPPGAKVLAQEGVVIRPQYLIRAGVAAYDRIEHLLRSAAYPSRAVPENLADLRAQVAANQLGVESLRRLARDHGHERVTEEMAALEDRAERLARRALQALPEGVYEACEHLDDGSAIEVRFELGHDGAVIDFATPAGVHPGNLNATPAIVHSAVIYVLRLLVGEPLPLNEGLMRAVTVRVAKGMLNPDFPDDPARAPAVGGGNVETSQRIVDALLKALGLCACSQGTMNNVVFGNDRFSYYETVGGGCGATRNCQGADAVHSHMTNTRITDIEIIEHRYPVRVRRFKIRRGSGGRGRFRGGDGVVRELEFLEPLSLSILSQHRRAGPYGLAGGGAGAPGSQRVLHPDGETLELGSIDGCEVGPGDRLILETPGGGGWG